VEASCRNLIVGEHLTEEKRRRKEECKLVLILIHSVLITLLYVKEKTLIRSYLVNTKFELNFMVKKKSLKTVNAIFNSEAYVRRK